MVSFCGTNFIGQFSVPGNFIGQFNVCGNSWYLLVRDRPFNLKGGGLWFFVSFRNFFSDNTRVRIYFFCRTKREFFFQNLTLGYMTKILNPINSFSSTKIRIFFSATLGIRIFFLEKNHNPPLQVKWSFP